MKNVLSNVKSGIVAWLAFILTVSMCAVAYWAYVWLSWVNSWDHLTKDVWNELIAKVNDIGTKTESMYAGGGGGGGLSDMVWREATQEVMGVVSTWTVVNYAWSGILAMVQANNGGYLAGTRLVITIDGAVWRTYTWVGAHGNTDVLKWSISDDTADANSGVVTIMPYKKFDSSLKVEIFNSSTAHESNARVNYFTAN